MNRETMRNLADTYNSRMKRCAKQAIKSIEQGYFSAAATEITNAVRYKSLADEYEYILGTMEAFDE